MTKSNRTTNWRPIGTELSTAAHNVNLGLLVRYTFRAFTGALQEVAASHSITAAEFRVLRTLSNRALTQLEIANQAAMDRPYAASIIRQLRLKKAIRSEPHAIDGRRVDLRLTKKGTRIVTAVSKHLSRVNKSAVKGIRPDDYATFLRVLVQVRQNLERASPAEAMNVSGSDS